MEIPIVKNSITEDMEKFTVHLNTTEDFDRGISFGQTEETITIIDMNGVYLIHEEREGVLWLHLVKIC